MGPARSMLGRKRVQVIRRGEGVRAVGDNSVEGTAAADGGCGQVTRPLGPVATGARARVRYESLGRERPIRLANVQVEGLNAVGGRGGDAVGSHKMYS